MGDKCCNLRTGEYFTVPNENYIIGLNKNDDDFSIIGEVSEKATWVTEGMEFGEDDWELMGHHKDGHNPTIHGKACLKEYWFVVDYIKFACPQCKHFH